MHFIWIDFKKIWTYANFCIGVFMSISFPTFMVIINKIFSQNASFAIGLITTFSNILYVGAEVIAGDSSVAYAQTSNLQPLNLCIANWCIDLSTPHYFTSYVMAGMIIGYLLGIVFDTQIYLRKKKC